MEKDNNSVQSLNRKDLLLDRASSLCGCVFSIVLLSLFLFLKWDRPLFLWLGKLFVKIPVLNLLPLSAYTDIPLVLDYFLLIAVVFCAWDLFRCLGGMVSDILKTSFLQKTERYWIWYFLAARCCALTIFLRLAINPTMFPALWLRQLGGYAHDVWCLEKWSAALLDFLDSLLVLLQIGLQLALCITCLIFVVSVLAVCLSSLLDRLRSPKPRHSKDSGTSGPRKPRKGFTGLRKDTAQEADVRCLEFLSSQELPEAEDSFLRVQIPDPREVDRDRLLQWNDRHEIYLRLANYELMFLRQEGRAYLLGSEKLELRPNVPEVVWVEGRTKSQKLILTYIV